MSRQVNLWLLTLSMLVVSACAVFGSVPRQRETVTIAQFGHLFLYLPIYVACDLGYFRDAGLDIHLVSTGGDEKTFTAVVTGNAQFGVSDPTFTAIAREHGRGGKVVAQIVSGIPLWVVTFNRRIKPINDASSFAGYRIATYTAPSTDYAVMRRVLENRGHPVKARLVQGAFGTLLALLKADRADMALEVEPVVSTAAAQGAHIIYAPGRQLGDFAFTGLTVADDFPLRHPRQIQEVVTAIARAMIFIHQDFEGTVLIAKKEFPDIPELVVRQALRRLINEGTIPRSPVLKKGAWDSAVALRREVGDLNGPGSFEQNVDMKYAFQSGQ